MIKRSIVYLIAGIVAAALITAQANSSKLLDGQPAIFLFPKYTPTHIIVQKSIQPITTSLTNTSDISKIQSNIFTLQKQLGDAQRLINTTNVNIFTIQGQINSMSKALVQAQKTEQERQNAVVSKVAMPVLQYDKLKHCSSDQTYGNTNYLSYLTHFSCGHVTVYPNGTVLRKFTLYAEDFNGSGKPIPISTNKTDPVMFPAWMFNGTVPGPTIRVTEGDHVQITLVNPKNSSFAHSMHMHSIHPGAMDGVMGAGGLIFPGTNFT
jgi:hypothetical protein